MTYNSSFTGAQVDEAVTKTQNAGATVLGTGNTPIKTDDPTNLILDSGAKLGIGTGTPDAPLTVSESSASTVIGESSAIIKVANLQSTSLEETCGLELFNRSTSGSGKLAGVYGVYTDFNITGYGGALAFATQSPGGTNVTERLRIDSSGDVIKGGASGPLWAHGTGSPEGAVTAPVGSFYSRTDGGAGTSFYVKESGTGNTGWVAK